MTAATLTLTDFLLARIGEDEAAARDVMDADIATVAHEHIARHNPARVLAECAAKRAIVDLHALHVGYQWPDKDADYCRTCGVPDEYPNPWPCDTIKPLATVYADHEDYRDEWRP